MEVATIDPAQLRLIELRRCLRNAREVEPLHQLVCWDQRLVVGVAPAEQSKVVADGLRQVALVAQLLNRLSAVALRKLLAIGAVKQREVGVARRLLAHRFQNQHLLLRIGKVVDAADHICDAGV